MRIPKVFLSIRNRGGIVNNRDPAVLMYHILQLHEEINTVSTKLHKDKREVFENTSQRIPVLQPAELGFLRAVSWLYVLYYEVGRVNVEFLINRLNTYHLDPDQVFYSHRITIHHLRTFLQHNLVPTEREDRFIQEYCEKWLEKQCRTPYPKEEDEWNQCLYNLLLEADNFITALRKCIRRIEKDESRDAILNEWSFQHHRHPPPHEFDSLISEIAYDMGRENLNVARLRNRFYKKWCDELKLLHGTYDFKVEARKLIEHAFLIEMTPVLPITGRDIMSELNIPRGNQVGELLKRANAYYNEGAHTRENLLQKLREELDLVKRPS